MFQKTLPELDLVDVVAVFTEEDEIVAASDESGDAGESEAKASAEVVEAAGAVEASEASLSEVAAGSSEDVVAASLIHPNRSGMSRGFWFLVDQPSISTSISSIKMKCGIDKPEMYSKSIDINLFIKKIFLFI